MAEKEETKLNGKSNQTTVIIFQSWPAISQGNTRIFIYSRKNIS